MGRTQPPEITRALKARVGEAFATLGPEVPAVNVEEWIGERYPKFHGEWVGCTPRADARLKAINNCRPSSSDRSRKARARRLFLLEVPFEIEPRRLSWRRAFHVAAVAGWLSALMVATTTGIWLWTLGPAGSVPGCLTSSLGCGLGQGLYLISGVSGAVVLFGGLLLLAEWVGFRDWLREQRARAVGSAVSANVDTLEREKRGPATGLEIAAIIETVEGRL